MVAGWDESGPGLYMVDSDGQRTRGKVFSVGSGRRAAAAAVRGGGRAVPRLLLGAAPAGHDLALARCSPPLMPQASRTPPQRLPHSCSLYAYGVLDNGYRWDLSVDEAVELGQRAIYHATFRDAASGGTVSGAARRGMRGGG